MNKEELEKIVDLVASGNTENIELGFQLFDSLALTGQKLLIQYYSKEYIIKFFRNYRLNVSFTKIRDCESEINSTHIKFVSDKKAIFALYFQFRVNNKECIEFEGIEFSLVKHSRKIIVSFYYGIVFNPIIATIKDFDKSINFIEEFFYVEPISNKQILSHIKIVKNGE